MASWWKKTQEQQVKTTQIYNHAVVLSNYAKHVKVFICAYLWYVQHYILILETIKTFVAILLQMLKYNMHTQCIIWDVHATKNIFWKTTGPKLLSAFIFSIKAFLCFSTFPQRHCQLDQDLCLLIWRGWNEPNTIKYDSCQLKLFV